jgi:hypothetical protein
MESNGSMLDGMKMIWKEMDVTWSTYYPGIRMDGLRKTKEYRSYSLCLGRDLNRLKSKIAAR